MKTLLESDPDIRRAHNIYQEFSGNSEYREIYEARLKWKKDYEGRLNYEQEKAREEGKKEGIKEGIKRARIEDARKMLENGVSLELVKKITGLTEDELNS